MLARYELLDTPSESEFDQIAALAAKLLNVPVALVSIVDAERLWFKSRHGLKISELPREMTFCDCAIRGTGPLVVPDATRDERFADSPVVTGPMHVRFYAGALLTTHDGVNLGTLCVLDTVPRNLSDSEVATLNQLAAIVMAAIEARRTEQRLRQEIAVHEQTTQALQVVQTRYQRIAENTPGLVFQFVRHTDGTGKFLFMSDACREILGLEPAVILADASRYFGLVHPEDRAARAAAVTHSLATLEPLKWMGRHVLASGQTKWLEISSKPEYSANGDVLWDGVVLDATERQDKENRLLMLESSVEHANDAILVTEAEPLGEPGPRIIYVNRAFTRMSGYTREEVVGKNPRMFQGPNTSPVAKDSIRAALKAWKPVLVELLNYRKDGTEFWVELNIVPVANEKGWYTHWVSVQRETSGRKEAQRVLEEARDEAQRANAAKSEFLSRMSHELRTPLNAILGFGQLLEMSEPTERQQESISHVLRGGRHLLDLINEVLDISSIEAGKIDLTLEPVHVASALEEITASLRPLINQRGIILDVQHAEFKLDGTTVLADRQRLKQVLLNLLSNAIKYNRVYGRVELLCEYAPGETMLRLSVRDNGPGIGAEDLPKLFLPFERLNGGQSAVEGTGIGLAITKRLVEAMNGTIGVKSTLGQGSTFWFELPMASSGKEQTLDAMIPRLKATRPVAAHKVLYVEDNLSNLTLIQAILAKRMDIELFSALCGADGWKLAREHQPELILLDLQLPDLAGDEVLRALKADSTTRDIPVVMVSADATAVVIERLLGLGAAAYLTKPFDIPAFLRTIVDTLALKR